MRLVDIYPGIAGFEHAEAGHDVGHDAGHHAAGALMIGNVINVLEVAVAHTLAMALAGDVFVTVIYFWLELRFFLKSWFNLDIVCAISPVLVSGFAIVSVYVGIEASRHASGTQTARALHRSGIYQ